MARKHSKVRVTEGPHAGEVGIVLPCGRPDIARVRLIGGDTVFMKKTSLTTAA